jgi:hypothetical protein
VEGSAASQKELELTPFTRIGRPPALLKDLAKSVSSTNPKREFLKRLARLASVYLNMTLLDLCIKVYYIH